MWHVLAKLGLIRVRAPRTKLGVVVEPASVKAVGLELVVKKAKPVTTLGGRKATGKGDGLELKIAAVGKAVPCLRLEGKIKSKEESAARLADEAKARVDSVAVE